MSLTSNAPDNAASFLDVKISGREYRVACPSEEREALLASVNLVNEKLSEISGKNMPADRAVVMVALNIAHDYLELAKGDKTTFDTAKLRRKIDSMDARLDSLLAQQEFSLG